VDFPDAELLFVSDFAVDVVGSAGFDDAVSDLPLEAGVDS